MSEQLPASWWEGETRVGPENETYATVSRDDRARRLTRYTGSRISGTPQLAALASGSQPASRRLLLRAGCGRRYGPVHHQPGPTGGLRNILGSVFVSGSLINLFWVACLVCLLLLPPTTIVRAQGRDPAWSPPINLSRSPTRSDYPVMVADQEGHLHVFWLEAQPDGEGTPRWLIMYTKWDGIVWSNPTDIIAAPYAGATISMVAAAVDGQGNLHLTWGGPPGGAISYSHGPIRGAASAKAWSAPRTVADSAYRSDVAVAGDGAVVVVYSRWRDIPGVCVTTSLDGGKNWSPPTEIWRVARADNLTVTGVRLALDGAGRMHVVWTENETPSYKGLRVLYALSEDGGATWSEAQVVATASETAYQADRINVLAVGDDRIHLVWNDSERGTLTPVRWHKMSIDGGRNWTQPERILAPRAGDTGYSEMAVDSAGVLYVVTAGYGGPNDPRGPSVGYWDGSRWHAPQMIATKEDDPSVPEAHWPRVTVTQGHHLHVVWMIATGIGAGEVWYTWRETPAPYVAPVPYPTTVPTLPVSVPTPTQELAPTAEQSPADNRSKVYGLPDTSMLLERDPWSPFVVGLVPVVVLLAAVFVSVLKRRGVG